MHRLRSLTTPQQHTEHQHLAFAGSDRLVEVEEEKNERAPAAPEPTSAGAVDTEHWALLVSRVLKSDRFIGEVTRFAAGIAPLFLPYQSSTKTPPLSRPEKSESRGNQAAFDRELQQRDAHTR